MSTPASNDSQLPSAGWYPDPAGAPGLRWWSGSQWTADIKDDPAATTVTGQPEPGPAPANPYQNAEPTGAWHPGGQPQYQGAWSPLQPATADGVELASWIRRVGGVIIDSFVVTLVAGLLFLPFAGDLIPQVEQLYEEIWRAAQTGDGYPSFYSPAYQQVMQSAQQFSFLTIAVAFIYSTGMQLWKSATLGMLALKMRVVPLDRGREHNGLPMKEALIRNIAYQALRYLSIVSLINGLSPLFNKRRQAIHDMVAKTQVVRIR